MSARLTPEEMALITEAVTKAIIDATKNKPSCGLCTSIEATIRHTRHHNLLDRIERFLDKLDGMKWKTMSGFLVTVFGSIFLALLAFLWQHIKNP